MSELYKTLVLDFSDLHRLFRASYSAAVSDAYLSNPFKPECDDDCPTLSTAVRPPSMGDILDRLEQETQHYVPANLCAEISIFPPLYWSDIGGYEDIKQVFINSIQQRLVDFANPASSSAQANQRLGLNVPRGVLLHGPPGKRQ